MSSTRSAAGIVVRRRSPAPDADPFLRYRALIDGAGSNKHDRAVVLIAALIGDGVTAGTDIVAMGKWLGLSPQHVGITLNQGTGNDPARFYWRRDEQGLYALLA